MWNGINWRVEMSLYIIYKPGLLYGEALWWYCLSVESTIKKKLNRWQGPADE